MSILPDDSFHRSSTSSASTRPSSGFNRPDRAAISVDLPDPDGPMTMVRSP
ncbi:hypothetical protein D3C81_2267940 [compost metagenome]